MQQYFDGFWIFKTAKTSVTDDEWGSRLSTSKTDALNRATFLFVLAVVWQFLSWLTKWGRLNPSWPAVFVSENATVCAWQPKASRHDCLNSLLHCVENPDFVSNIVTCDGSWIYAYEPDISNNGPTKRVPIHRFRKFAADVIKREGHAVGIFDDEFLVQREYFLNINL